MQGRANGRLRRLGAAVVAVGLLSGSGLLAACSSSSPPGRAATPSPTPSSSSGSSSSGPSPSAAGAASTASGAALTAPIAWKPCSGGAGPSGYQCATIQVPRNPSDPSHGGTIGLALDRRPAGGHPIGSLLVNPGGPGGSGVDFLPEAVGFMPASLLDHFNVVGFDPPGVARSAPIQCLDDAGLERYFHADPVPTTQGGLDAVISEYRTFAQGCQKNSGAELPYVSTVDAARDMDYIRQAVGDAKLTYLGFSYGTFLGATYAGLYPDRIRAMVLDGAIDPSLSVIAGLDAQSAAIDADLRAVFSSCSSSPKCAWKPGGDLAAAYQQLTQRVRAHPLPVDNSSRTVGPAELLYGTAAALYSTSTWGFLENALASADAGNGTPMMELFDAYTGRTANGHYSNEFEANTAVNCLDAPAPTQAQIMAAAPAAAAAAPVFGVGDLYSELGCTVWPVPATGRPGPIHAVGSPPIVVVGTTGDPATPYSEAVSLARQLDHGVLLTRVGEGHTAYPYSTCIRDHVDAYLTDLTVPAVGTTCQSG